jgi:hypothetical protein
MDFIEASGLKKPDKLQVGDKVALITLSCGLSGDIAYRYEIGKGRLTSEFGLQVANAILHL